MLHLVAGIGAVCMACGILIRGPWRVRNRLFVLLCAALALWNLAFVLRHHGYLWRPVYLFGASVAAPLSLHFSLVLVGKTRAVRGRYLWPAYLIASGVWISSWLSLPGVGPHWNRIAIVGLGGILAVSLSIIARHAFTRPSGPERRALLYILVGGVIAVLGGMSDFVPRGQRAWTEIGPLTMLLFLLIVCVVLMRYRFLDVETILARTVALIAASATAALALLLVIRFVDDGFLALFATILAVLAIAVPLGRTIVARSRRLSAQNEPLARALLETSRKLPQAVTAEELWNTIDVGRRTLPGLVRIDVYLRRSHQQRFHLLFRSGESENVDSSPVHRTNVLPRMLDKERLPLTRWYLHQERLEARPLKRRRIEKTLEEFDRLNLHLAAPFYIRERIGGWLAMGGDIPEESLTAELAAEFMAVTNQAAAALNRIEAMETLRRKEALAAVGELAAGLAHEVRNPVAAIHGAAQAMGPSATEDQRREMLEVIEEETDRLGRVVGEFLSYARPGSPRRQAVDLVALTRRVIRAIELAGRDLKAELHVDAPPAPALGDPDQLYRVFENLTRNAWEATGDGGRLRIDLYNVKNDRVAIRFEDNGPGIAVADTRQLFKPFHTTKPGGTGLGLALVHRIVEAHEGEISVEGRPGIGAAFTVVLPAAESPPQASDSQRPPQ
jgi:signal transduction histidine kinase